MAAIPNKRPGPGGPSPSASGTLTVAMEHHKHGRLREAEILYRRTLADGPKDARALAMLGYLLQQTNRDMEALTTLDRSLALAPNDAEAHAWRGITLQRLGRWQEAAAAYAESTRADPRHRGAHNNLGVALVHLHRYGEAIPHLERAIELGHNRPEPHVMLGRARVGVGRTEAAERAFRAALALDAGFIDARVGLANVLHDTGDLDAALEALRLGLEASPQALGARSNLMMKLLYHDGIAAEVVAEEHRAAGKEYLARFAAGSEPAWRERDRSPERRLRIGYISPDFHLHATAFFLDPLLASHDREAVEIHCYNGAATADAMTAHLRGLSHAWRDIAGRPERDVAALVAADRIDVLVDCAGHTNNHRLGVLAMKPAPVQITWLGYPHTTGLPTVDYRLTDALADPPGMTEPLYVEELVRLPEGSFCYRAPASAPEPAPGPLERGKGPVFGCFNNPHKIGPRTIRLFADAVNAVPGARLRLKARSFLDPRTRDLFRERFVAAGLSAERIELEGRRSFAEGFAEYATIDVALDPFPYHGTTSTCESLWMGVPVVTLPGPACVSRVGVSLLERVGLGDLVARDAAHYADIAASLARDPARLADLRRSLRGTMAASALCDGPRFARQMEAAYRAMWKRYCATSSARKASDPT